MRDLERCPVCRSDSDKRVRSTSDRTWRHPADENRWVMAECGKCGLCYLDPQPTWEDMQPYYSADYEAYAEDDSPVHGPTEAEWLEEARQTGKLRHVHIREGMHVLDIGCATGRFLRAAEKLGATTKGVEPSGVAAEAAREAGVDVFHGTVDEYVATEPTDRFDLITLCHVLEHVNDPVATLTACKKLLAEGGVIWIAVPNRLHPFFDRLTWRWHGTDLPYHLLHFTPDSLAQAGANAGFKVRKNETKSDVSGIRASLSVWLRHRFFVPRKLSMMPGPIRWMIDSICARLARAYDQRQQGEAIELEFEASA